MLSVSGGSRVKPLGLPAYLHTVSEGPGLEIRKACLCGWPGLAIGDAFHSVPCRSLRGEIIGWYNWEDL